jgi:hypothetical protein
MGIGATETFEILQKVENWIGTMQRLTPHEGAEHYERS